MLTQNNQNYFRRFLETLKRVLGMERYVKYYRFYRRMISGYYILTNSARKTFLRNLLRTGYQLNQRPLVWDISIPFMADSTELTTFLKNEKVCFLEGGWSIYIPPQAGLTSILGQIIEFYPEDAGFKIVKNFNSPEKARYLSTKSDVISWPESVVSGNLFSQLNAACIAELLSLSPRIYDLIDLRADNLRMSCFVVQHIERGHPTTISDFELFIARLDEYVRSKNIQTVVPYLNCQHMDFSPPNCNNNLIKSSDEKLYYVDFQQFAVRDHKASIISLLEANSGILSFGDVHPFRSKKPYLYQTIPGIDITGRRDSELRWEIIKGMLGSAQIDVSERVVLDICCNSGIMLSRALIDGALWGLGWDLPEVINLGMKIQRILGFTRLTMMPAQLSESYSLLRDIDQRIQKKLNGSIVFYLAAWNHIGFIAELAAIPWKALVFEGHEHTNDYSDVITMMKDRCHAELAEQRIVLDGDSQSRRILLFVR